MTYILKGLKYILCVFSNKKKLRRTKNDGGSKVNKRIRFTSLLLAIVLVLSMTLLAGCGKDSKEDVVVTINDEEIYLSEAMYYIYSVEANFGMMLGSDYWDTVVEDERTFGELTKEYVMDGLVEMHIMSEEGTKAGLEIDSQLETQLKTSAVDFYNSMTDQLKEITGLTERSIYNIIHKNYIAALHKNEILADLDIDIEAIEAEYNREEYRQYNTQYLHIPFVTTDDDNNEVELTDAEKTEAKATLEKALSDVQSGKTFAEIAEEYEDIKSSSANFLPGDEYTVSVAYQNIAMELENDEVTEEIVETEDGYYIIMMVDNDSAAYYNAVINDAANQKQQELYLEKYEEIKEEYTVTINDEVWDPIKVGRTTINLDIEDDADSENQEETGDSNDSSESEDADNTEDAGNAVGDDSDDTDSEGSND